LDRYVFDLTLLGWGLFVIHVGCGFDGFFSLCEIAHYLLLF